MADTVDTGLLPRTYFKAPRVPFDFRALALAMLGYLVYWGGSLLLNEIFEVSNLVGSFLAAACNIFEGIPFLNQVIPFLLGTVLGGGDLTNFPLADYTFWHKLVGGVWVFVVWSFFGQAICRITALRIARDEGLSFVEAFRFAARNWVTVILAPMIIAVTIAFFYGCDALAGLAISIPWAGQILALVLVPLALISSLLILLIAIGGIFGLPLIGSAAAWERNGTLDAISRAFSYVFARPLQFFWNYFLIFLFVGVILLAGSWFTYVLTKSVDSGTLSDRLSVMIDAPKQIETGDSEFVALSEDAQKDFKIYEEKTGYKPGRGAPGVQPYAKDFQTVIHAPWSHKLNAFIFWLCINLIWLGIFGYVIYWFLGATTSVYADLRADVDGTEEDEIYLEEDEEDFDALAEVAGDAETEPPTATEGESPPASADTPATDSAPADDSGPTGDSTPTGDSSPPEDSGPAESESSGEEPASDDEGEKPSPGDAS